MPHAVVGDRQRGRAKQLRQAMTRAETLLWRYLKAHHVDHLSFRRQTPIGRYVLDFVCHRAKLVVELDGETHDFEARHRGDQARDAWLETRGYRVLRFTNAEVLNSLEGVLITIREAARSRISSPPSLPLPRKGGGDPQTIAPDSAHSPAAPPRGSRS
jgi:very-short-patch-repair endonuclease